MSARAEILGRLSPREASALPAEVHQRIARAADWPVVERFAAAATAAGALVIHCDDLSLLPAQLREAVPLQGVAPALWCAPSLAGLQWEAAGWERTRQITLAATPAVVVTHCVAACAETGSVLLASDTPHRPSLNLLARTHVVLVDRARIVAQLEDALEPVLQRHVPPRSAVLVTGPSRSADIEQTLEVGVHGALALVCVLLPAEQGGLP